MALLKGLIIIEQLNLIPIEINTDSIEIIKILIDNNLLYVGIVDDYRYMLRGLGNPVVWHSFREQNIVADAVTKMGSNSDVFGSTTILEVPPVCARHALWADVIGTTFERSIRCNSGSPSKLVYQFFDINPGWYPEVYVNYKHPLFPS